MRAWRISAIFYSFGIVILAILNSLGLFSNSPLQNNFIQLLICLNLILLVVILVLEEKAYLRLKSIYLNLHGANKNLQKKNIVDLLVETIRKKEKAFSLNLIENRLKGRDELAKALEKITSLAYELLGAESAELALYDRESKMYHSSFVIGKPFRVSSQAMLSGAVENENEISSPDVIVRNITFAEEVLGSLRIGFQKGTMPTRYDIEVLRALSLQSSIAIINAQYTSQLLRMKQHSEESLKVKTGFLANLSHEIRGPLGIMINAVEVVLDGLVGDINDEQRSTIEMISKHGSHLLDLINDVLDYAKIESGKVVPTKETIQLNLLLKDIVSVMKKEAEQKSHTLMLKIDKDLLGISCDKRHFRQILINLITNAIKYTKVGGEIVLEAERIPRNKIKISVKDNGVGISAQDRNKVFSAFERIDSEYSSSQTGTGLGMPLTKKLVKVNDGIIDFDSQLGKGSHFWIIFPAVDLKRKTSKLVASDAKKEIKGNGECILLIELNPDESGLIQRFLTESGFYLVAVDTHSDALSVLQERRVDLIIIDNKILDTEGDELISIFRKKSQNSSIPVALLSSRAFAFDVEKYLKLGVDRCISKPVDLKELAHISVELVRRSRSSDVESTANDNRSDLRIVSRVIRKEDLN